MDKHKALDDIFALMIDKSCSGAKLRFIEYCKEHNIEVNQHIAGLLETTLKSMEYFTAELLRGIVENKDVLLALLSSGD